MARDKEMAMFNAGMEYALRIAKVDGVEGLEKELKCRNAIGIRIPVTNKELQQASDNIRQMMFDTMLTASIAVLNQVFGFGSARCKRFMEGFKGLCDITITEDFAGWDRYINYIEEKLGISIALHRNDKNTEIQRRY